MSNIALQVERLAAGSVANGANVIFDSIVFSSGNISYNSATGVVTFNQAGRYIINWWVATQSTAPANSVVFAFSTSQGDFLEGDNPAKTSEVVGVGVIDVTVSPVTASLVNASTATVFLSTVVPVKATLLIFQENPAGATGPTGPTARVCGDRKYTAPRYRRRGHARGWR